MFHFVLEPKKRCLNFLKCYVLSSVKQLGVKIDAVYSAWHQNKPTIKWPLRLTQNIINNNNLLPNVDLYLLPNSFFDENNLNFVPLCVNGRFRRGREKWSVFWLVLSIINWSPQLCFESLTQTVMYGAKGGQKE